MGDFAVLRVSKIKTTRGLRGVEEHNDAGERLRGRNLEADWRARLGEAGAQSPRKNAVLAVEVVCSASPGWFETGDADDWRERSVAWLDERFGAENVVGLWSHTHEDTPHLHAVVLPLVRKARKGTGREYVSLDTRSVLGGPRGLRDLQTSYARAVEALGIARGLPSPTKNEPTRHHRARLDEATRRAEQRERAAHDVLRVAQAVPHALDTGLAVVDDEGRLVPTARMRDENRQLFDLLLSDGADEAKTLAGWLASFFKRHAGQRAEVERRPVSVVERARRRARELER